MPPSDPETISPDNQLPPGALWIPQRGHELGRLLARLPLDDESKDRLVSEATTILGKCIPPGAPAGSTTGLVLGYVQSGKTLSFTTVAALARDNGFPVVIVITGTKTNLNDQSRARLEEGLDLDSSRQWVLLKSPKADQRSNVLGFLRHWQSDSRLPRHRRQALLITVLKHPSHLGNLIALLSTLSAELATTPVLIFDDEADQAGLNNLVNQGRTSTVYQRLVSLRRCLPHHTYLQYTATPQAPLLINLIDTLSPRFAETLSAGADYVGGKAFFRDNPSLVRVIPAAEIPSKTNLLDQAPPSLIRALKIFFLGVAAGFHREEDDLPGMRNRSMLVHPSRETPGHQQFFRWISYIKEEWWQVLSLPDDSHERQTFLEGFTEEYEDLRTTVDDLPSFDSLVAELPFSIDTTRVLEVNTRPRPQTPSVPWRDRYPWILVGGEAMERGFTVEGLTVTYMPRDLGVGNADTIQQRARFFGYKRRFLGYCRVFLESSVNDAFRFYVDHEEDIRARLMSHSERGRPLTEWRRAFFLDTSLRPTRRQVLQTDYEHDTFGDKWYWPRVPHGAVELLDPNRDCVARLVGKLQWREDDGDDRRTEEQKHLVAEGVSLATAYNDLLLPLRMTDELDSQRLTGILLQIGLHLDDHPGATCTVYQMRKGERRKRSVGLDSNEIPFLFQGANYADSDTRRDQTYPGDEAVRNPQGLTIQLHRLTVQQHGAGATIADDVPAVAIWVPEIMEKDWLVQAGS